MRLHLVGWLALAGVVAVWTAVLAGWTIASNALILALTPIVSDLVGAQLAYWVMVAVSILVIASAYAVHARFYRAPSPRVINLAATGARDVAPSPADAKL